jgi:hypothetical protein
VTNHEAIPAFKMKMLLFLGAPRIPDTMADKILLVALKQKQRHFVLLAETGEAPTRQERQGDIPAPRRPATVL